MAASFSHDGLFKALADPSRRRLLDSLNARNGQTLGELCSHLPMARQSVSKHLGVLEAANLITTVRRGREKLHYLNPVPINEIGERWITQYDRGRVRVLADLKTALEAAPMDNRPSFVYTTFIRTTPERLWQGLTDPAFTTRYWNIALEGDWRTDSTLIWKHNGVRIVDEDQRVVEADPYRRLSYTWHSFTPEWARAVEIDEQRRARLAAERRSKVTFEIERIDDEQVKLTVIHDDLEPDGLLVGMISGGWPRVIANLKTLLETGEPLPDIRGRR
jgi:DNA-binding transcriptional ArsR family regulator/uncharacterized protein YndB with AHSA1/START domain